MVGMRKEGIGDGKTDVKLCRKAREPLSQLKI
jgi:hypothetical protein